jgi:hypothetical protein
MTPEVGPTTIWATDRPLVSTKPAGRATSREVLLSGFTTANPFVNDRIQTPSLEKAGPKALPMGTW